LRLKKGVYTELIRFFLNEEFQLFFSELPMRAYRQSFCIILQKGELMKQYSLLGLYALAMAMTLESCRVVGGIFKAGVWVGILLVVFVVGIILWLVGRGRS
jgi:hypothetical protein